MPTVRSKWFLWCVLAAVLFASMGAENALAKEDRLPPPQIGEDGLHKQDWFIDSFLNLSEDLQEAAGKGKRLVIFWEQKGCPYCRATHEVNLRIPKIANYIKANFHVLQLNLWGDREVTDFDGEVLPEKKMANKYGILFTPTLQFFPETLAKAQGKNKGKSGKDAEVVRIPGYFKPFHFYFLFRYAFEKGYETEPNFQRWLSVKGDELREKGIDVDGKLWLDSLDID